MSRPHKYHVTLWVEGELLDERRDVIGVFDEVCAGAAAWAGAEDDTNERDGQVVWDVTLELGERVDIYWNDRAPPGWVEVQRDDETARELSDLDAAREVCDAAEVPYACIMDDENLILVPAIVAWLAGLIDDEDLYIHTNQTT